MSSHPPLIAVVPAAGVGQRMKSSIPKQYLHLNGKTILEHSVERLFSHPRVDTVVVAVSADDAYFADLSLASNPNVIRVDGGSERVNTVHNALKWVMKNHPEAWVLVHDAARPCVRLDDIDALISQCEVHPVGGILAAPVRDTMKRADGSGEIDHTVERIALWHALTPQMFPATTLFSALEHALSEDAPITDEASAFERLGLRPLLVTGRADNLKITQPEDLVLAEFYLSRFIQG